MPELTSLQNPRVKRIVRLRGDRRQRQREGLTIVEGQYELELALSSGISPQETFYCEELSCGQSESLLNLNPISVTPEVFKKMSQRENPDGWLAILPIPRRSLDTLRLSQIPFVILAESIEKPGNLGAILRSADAAGVDCLLLCDQLVELYNPNVVRASRGTLFTVPAVETTKQEALAWIKTNNMRILATMPKGDTNYTEVEFCQPICILVGTEDEGLSDFWINNADIKARIPMMGKVNSLNVSTSTAIVLYEAVRQRNQRSKN
jgi:RNA methyltransferase, TrmH family